MNIRFLFIGYYDTQVKYLAPLIANVKRACRDHISEVYPSFHDFPDSGFSGFSSLLTAADPCRIFTGLPFCRLLEATECQRHISDLHLTPWLKIRHRNISNFDRRVFSGRFCTITRPFKAKTVSMMAMS